MCKFKTGDIVKAIADNSEFVNNEHGRLFKVTKVKISRINMDYCLEITNGSSSLNTYYYYKFKKATRKERERFKFEYIVNKLKR